MHAFNFSIEVQRYVLYRYQQPAAPAEAAAGDPGDGVADVSVGAARHGLRRARLRGHEPRVDRERLAALARSHILTLLY